MKVNNINKIFCGLLVLLATLSSCKKESENTYDIFKGLTVNFKEAIGSDEVYVEFNLNKAASGAIMSKVVLTEIGGAGPVYTAAIDYVNRYSYSSGVVVLKTNSPATASYIITILDDLGNDITSQVTISYPAGQQVVKNPVLITDKTMGTFKEGTTVYIDYTISSRDADIKYIWLESFASGTAEPTRVNISTLPDGTTETRNIRGVVRLKMERSGGSKFRLYVTDGANDYIGDGYTSISTNTTAEFELAANKFIYAPIFESTKENPDITSASFYSISKKRTYNYTEAKANAADIDFGIFLTATGNPIVPYTLSFYSISVGQNLYNNSSIKFNVGEWTIKRAIKFTAGFGEYKYTKPGETSETTISAATLFLYNLNSGLAMNTWIAQGTFRNSITRSGVPTTAGNMFFFLTQEGKYGAVFVNGFGKDYLGRWYTNIDVKVQK